MLASSCSNTSTKTVSGDLLKNPDYTLPNGLKV